MKKLLLVLTLAISASISFSQSFIDFGPKLFFGPNVLMNSEIMNSGGKYSMNPASFGFGAGFKLAFDINESIAIVGEINYTPILARRACRSSRINFLIIANPKG
mgnify:CR=1 FL=1